MLKEFSLKISLRLGIALSALSRLFLTASMPGFDVPYAGWFALVPLLIVLMSAEIKKVYFLALPFGIVFSIGVHSWYPSIFQPAEGYILIINSGLCTRSARLSGVFNSVR